MKIVLFATLLCTVFVQLNAIKIPGIDYPLTAQCAVKWNFPALSCDSVKQRLVDQVNKWDGDVDQCTSNPGNQRCLYKMKSTSATQLLASHTTPIKRYVDSLTFTFNQAGAGCNVDGYSKSDLWYAVLDYGTNYCNLENLITGAELHTSNGYVEATQDTICTQYSSANCELYR